MPNPVLRRVPRAEMTPRLQQEYDDTLKLRDDATMQEVGANAPELMAWYKDEFYGKLFYSGRVDVRTKELLTSLYRQAGVSSDVEQIAFCNTGHWASLGWFASHEVIGNKKVLMYDGSMAEWTLNDALPIEQKISLN